ncbi:MAG: hypothetical protein AAF226_02265 [Verrucomicrobiota bacterium]
MTTEIPQSPNSFDPFLIPEDWARLQYGRILWKNKEQRQRLLDHWTDDRHPYKDRFISKYRSLVEQVLASSPEKDDQLDSELRASGHSLRTIVREIPPVFGSFY